MAKKSRKRSKQNRAKRVEDLSPGTKVKNVKGGGERRGDEIHIESLSWGSPNR
jgi:hypothetical protein